MARVLLAILLLVATPAATSAQGERGLLTRNPLDEIKAELVDVLAEAGEPFTAEQNRAITLVLEESRRASEQLFGSVMDFSDGPPQGEQLDRAQAGIAWMNEDFSRRVREHLTPAQLAAWDAHIAARTVEAAEGADGEPAADSSQRVQQIRINNNPFTPENQSGGSFGGSSGSGVQAQIIQRGGIGAWHGSYEFRFKDESLNARNAFASNKPPYQQRNINLSTGGPLVRERLTFTGGFNQSESDNAETVNALTPSGPVTFGFTLPYVSRSGFANGTLQLTGAQSLHFTGNVGWFDSHNQTVGGFTLPERAVDYGGHNGNVSLRHVWFASDRTVQDITIRSQGSTQVAAPITSGVSTTVLGAFNGGSGQAAGDFENRGGSEEVDALWIHTRDDWSLRLGGYAHRPRSREIDRTNFAGTFVFSDLDGFAAGQPILFTASQGEPLLEHAQVEWSLFLQHELQITSGLTFFSGVRYERQTNLGDHNVGPRISVAYVLGTATVVRAGAGLYHDRIGSGVETTLARFDGTRQREIVVIGPSYPDPYRAGDVTIVPPASRRVRAEDLRAPRYVNSSVQLERSFPWNLFVTVSYDYRQGRGLLRSVNLNPLRGDLGRPNPDEGNVWRLESSARSTSAAFRVNLRQRFSVLNVTAGYSRQAEEQDSVGTFGAPTNNDEPGADLARTMRQNLNLGINARVPWGVYLTTSLTFRNGNPYTITTGRDDNGDGVTNDRPPGVARQSERGPAYSNVNMNVSKAFRIGGPGSGSNLNVFASASNVLNQTHLGNPVGIVTSPLFGRSISAFGPREIEVGVRFQF